MNKPYVGGQALIEGVMMKSPDCIAMAVRTPDGRINIEKQSYQAPGKKHKILGLPVVRGVANFLDMMVMGVRTLTDSARISGEEEGEGEISNGMLFGSVLLSLALSVGLFILLPNFLVSLLKPLIASSILLNLFEGLLRIAIFVGYVAAISTMKDIRRVFMYHGAEHKTVFCYEHDLPLTVENARKFRTLHPRCGTSFLVIVMVISILIFSLIKWDMSWYARMLLRVALLPVVAGISYEVLYLLARHENKLVCALRWPGLQLQRLTTREPDDDMLECAIAAMKASLGMETGWEEETADDCAGSPGILDGAADGRWNVQAGSGNPVPAAADPADGTDAIATADGTGADIA